MRLEDLSLHPSTAGLLSPLANEDDLTPTFLSPIPWTSSQENSGATSSEPGEVKLPEVLSPAHEFQPVLDLGFANLVGGALPPTDALPTPALQRAGHRLRLPSFNSLGITSPQFNSPNFVPEGTMFSMNGGLLSQAEDPTDPRGGLAHPPQAPMLPAARPADYPFPKPPEGHPKAICSPLRQYIATITPPDEGGYIDWSSLASVTTAAAESPATDPGTAPLNSQASSPAPDTSLSQSLDAVQIGRSGIEAWLGGAVEIMLSNVYSMSSTHTSVKVLSHALPSPSARGHAFPFIINAIHEHIPPSPTVWINVFHAVPGRFNIADLPTSPPSTPGPAVGGDDYFTTKIFDSAVPVSDYQSDAPKIPSSPHPVVPPSTVNVSVVERYIPPTSANEFAEMFTTTGSSLLVDRLVELSPNHGTFIFIYPTRTGGRTFMNEYLGPILDPLLRSMVVVNGLSADLSSTLGRMAAVDSLPEFETMQRKINMLCRQLSRGSSSLERFHGRSATFSLVYSSKEEVVVDRKVWASDWWIKQEKPRIRTTVAKFFRMAQKLPADSNIMPTDLIQEIINGVASKPYAESATPRNGIEVGVFVIKRSS
ncbi:hypothetical protein LTR04_007126 [Oleoguttula sp. CCFEE 6159]|nr:hypothetical protein LTR04_007126 [Oleoguttula sp. CCFEE 6159]